MSDSLGLISAFLGGAVVGAAAAILFAPEKGEDLRERICKILRKNGIVCSEQDVDALVARLTKELDEE